MSEYSIIPQPKSVKYMDGTFECGGVPQIASGGDFESEAGVFRAQIAKIPNAAEGPGKIRLAREGGPGAEESYKLEIRTDEIVVRAESGAGAFRGLQVLRQLILSGFDGTALSVPCGTIEDKPRFGWRGFMLDCSRHFFSVEYVKNLLDALSLHHVNVFHWHLTDDQGWRLPVKEYPLLTEIGGRRYDSREWRHRTGVYGEADIREVVAFAAERHIEVVPEVDLPGHASAILAAYPGLGCTGGPYKVEERYGIFEDVLCAGNDGIFDLARAIFASLAELFPSKYVHIGGDEVRFGNWKECPKCRARAADLGLDRAEQLQSWITARLVKMLGEHGKTAIGWDEILENTEKFPLPENAVVMSWRGSGGGNHAVGLGRRAIMTPNDHGCYLDYRCIDDPDEIGRNWGVGTVAQGFNLRPITAEMGEKAAELVLGGQGNLWTETVYSGKLAEYLIFPRICAIAEALWTAGADRDIADFESRLSVHRRRLERLGLLQYLGPLG